VCGDLWPGEEPAPVFRPPIPTFEMPARRRLGLRAVSVWKPAGGRESFGRTAYYERADSQSSIRVAVSTPTRLPVVRATQALVLGGALDPGMNLAPVDLERRCGGRPVMPRASTRRLIEDAVGDLRGPQNGSRPVEGKKPNPRGRNISRARRP